MENFLLFFNLTGLWGAKLFRQFNEDGRKLISMEEFFYGLCIFQKIQLLRPRLPSMRRFSSSLTSSRTGKNKASNTSTSPKWFPCRHLVIQLLSRWAQRDSHGRSMCCQLAQSCTWAIHFGQRFWLWLLATCLGSENSVHYWESYRAKLRGAKAASKQVRGKLCRVLRVPWSRHLRADQTEGANLQNKLLQHDNVSKVVREEDLPELRHRH